MGIVKHIPNTITSLNIVSGAIGVIFTFSGRLDAAFCMMLAAAVCDFCDGLSARLLNAYSPLGKELDSLADMVSFGLLPSLMLHKLMAGNCGCVLGYVPLVIAVFSALRLAKFNIDDRQTDNFIGLPTPACAMLCGSFVYYVSNDPSSVLHTWAASRLFIPIASVLLSLLLVSEIPMFSMKFKKSSAGTPAHKQRLTFLVLAALTCIIVPVMKLNWTMIPLLIFTIYIIMNLGILLFCRK